MSTEDVAYYANEFRASGFTAPLNWYRSMSRTTELMAPWRGTPIRQPSMFIAGSRDDVMSFPSSRTALERFPTTLPELRSCHLIEGAGHWIQRERAAVEVHSFC